MTPQLEYPDLVPPPAWTYFRAGPQIRLIPPGTRADTSPVAIIVSPIVPRAPQMPAPAQLIAMALEAEAKVSFTITEQRPATAVETTTGLAGVACEVTGHARPDRPMERRIYVLYADDRFLYGINYLASPDAYDDHVATFWAVAASIRPFDGRAVPAPPPPPLPFHEE